MTNQEAIKIIERAIGEVEWEYPIEYAAAFDKAIQVLSLVQKYEIKIAELEIQIMKLNNEIEEWKERD